MYVHAYRAGNIHITTKVGTDYMYLIHFRIYAHKLNICVTLRLYMPVILAPFFYILALLSL